jgi:PAS domain S-box-containing protein
MDIVREIALTKQDRAKKQSKQKDAEFKTDGKEPKSSDKSLIQEEERRQKILDMLIEHVVYHDMEMKVLWANRTACRSAGLGLEEVVGRYCYEIWAQRSAPCDDCPVKLAHATGRPQSVEKRTPEGRCLHINASPMFDADGRIKAMVELTLDITERKEMENALKKNEEYLKSLIETIPHGIQEIDPKGTITFANPAHHKIYGYHDQKMIGKSILDLQVSSSAKIDLSNFLAKLVEEQPEPTPYLSKNHTKDGRLIDVQVDWNYKRDDKGRVIGFISIVTDITEKNRATEALRQTNDELEHRIRERITELRAANEQLIREAETRKKAQEALEASQTELSTIFDNTPVVTVIVDEQRRVRKANLAAMSLVDLPEEEMVGRRAGEALRCLNALDDPGGCGCGPSCRNCKVRLAVLKTFQSGKPTHEIEATLLFMPDKKRRKLHLLVSTAPLNILGNNMVVVCLQDISSRKQAEMQLAEVNKTLVERTKLAEKRAVYIQQLAMELSNAEYRERQRLGSILHDDFQQTLAYLKIKLNVPVPEGQGRENLAQLNNLIDECISRCRNLAYELSPPMIRRKGFLGSLQWLCRQMEETQGLEVTLRATDGIEIDSSALSSMLIHSVRELLFNIVKHSGENCAIVEVKIDANQVHITVKDMGRGSDPGTLREKQENETVFGLLSIEDRVNFLGGSMRIESKPGDGFAVILRIPVDNFPSRKHQKLKGADVVSEQRPHQNYSFGYACNKELCRENKSFPGGGE